MWERVWTPQENIYRGHILLEFLMMKPQLNKEEKKNSEIYKFKFL
jgi:hypothetical protein